MAQLVLQIFFVLLVELLNFVAVTAKRQLRETVQSRHWVTLSG